MAQVHIHGVRVVYDTVGDGFPLLLLPGTSGAWEPTLPLLGELCRAIAYEVPAASQVEGAEAIALLNALTQALGLERAYIASQPTSWPLALEFALQSPQRLEGLLLLGTHAIAPHVDQRLAALTPRLRTMTATTLLLSTTPVCATCPAVDRLSTHLPRCTAQVLPDTATATDPRRLALQMGHAMMAFLLQCERQRNLVRGASFLL